MTGQAGAAAEYRATRSVIPAMATDRLTAEVRRGVDLDPHDARALDAIIVSRPYVGAFVSPAWLNGFLMDPRSGTDMFILLLRQGIELRALVPLAIRQTRTGVRVSFIGGGAGSDRIDLVAARGFEALAADTFLAWLAQTFGARGYLLELRDVPATSSLWGAIQRAGAERTVPVALQPREIYTLPYLSLDANDSPAIVESPSSRALKSLVKHRRWLEHRCHLQIDRISSPESAQDAFDHLARFLGNRWRGATSSVLDDPRVVNRHRSTLPRLLAENRLRMIRLRGDDRTIAVFYGIASGKWWGYYLAGYDRVWAGRIRLGQITLAIAVECARLEGATEFDFLKGAERLKYVWPVHERTTIDADLFSEKSGVQFTRATRATRDAAVALSKSAKALFPASLNS